MDLLKKENWWVWLIITILSNEVAVIILAALLKVFRKDAWYAKWQNWLIGALCLIFPVFIMFAIFMIQITCESAAKLDVPGKEIYLSPYIWIIGIIIPVIGWVLLGVLSLYLTIYTIVMLYRGAGEKYIQ